MVSAAMSLLLFAAQPMVVDGVVVAQQDKTCLCQPADSQPETLLVINSSHSASADIEELDHSTPLLVGVLTEATVLPVRSWSSDQDTEHPLLCIRAGPLHVELEGVEGNHEGFTSGFS